MGLFGFSKQEINEGVAECFKTPKAVLIDVRTPAEYAKGHIESSINIPLDRIAAAPQKISDQDIPLFVHCLSGARSAQAVSALKQMGYRNVKNIGGIQNYRGKVVK